ncbi:hypothetical protein C8A00DRAFT_38682 [Chaetomidium leptoderma]|uniref:Uncharacterized protein n=1 Tax=Chaetomidium leptoderma TaxID=669021 RepID=A0AAN6ZSM4_9PEZI|nr:hypothetical protein C8A00DRAFT_38682 [Chaetomidium leptoderma]
MRNPLPKLGRFFARLRKQTAAKPTPDTVPPALIPAPAPVSVLVPNAPVNTAVETTIVRVAPTAALEALPAELRCQVLAHLSELGLADLTALVRASPVFYQQYLLDRKALLGRGLKTTLGNVLVDAYAVQTSGSLYELHLDYQEAWESPHQVQPETIKLLMDEYVALRSATPVALLEDSCTEEDLVGMAAFYRCLAQPLSVKCATLFLEKLDTSLGVGNLSGTESTRLLRALYRYQFYCNLFGEGRRGHRNVVDFNWQEQLAAFFCVFRPWGIEEIHCIYILLRNTYDHVFETIRCDFDRDDPGSWDLEDNYVLGMVREGTASRGLKPFYKILTTNDHQLLVERMKKYLALPGVFIETTLDGVTQHLRRELRPMEGDRLEARGARLPFSGDAEDAPPLAWVIAWRATYSNTYGKSLPDSLKEWGYVFWDNKRLIKSKGVDVVLGEREIFS